ncbi:hypothetical protein [Peribacillus simplex]|uniref:hypothetical protein n=1 Tax=Peribacillus simplex TaxID=1478 RepID=UPI003D27162A
MQDIKDYLAVRTERYGGSNENGLMFMLHLFITVPDNIATFSVSASFEQSLFR